MSKLRPYIAIDIETTGLSLEKSQILQIGWVIDDGVSPLDQLERGSIFVKNSLITYGEPFAMAMNGWIFTELYKKSEDRKYKAMPLEEALFHLSAAIEKTRKLVEEFEGFIFDGVKRAPKVQLSGKNVGSFDWPIIKNNLERAIRENMSVSAGEYLESSKLNFEGVDHRTIDVGSAFFQIFGKNPGFNDINKLIGWKPISHDALDDAINVVVANRYLFGIKEKP